MKTLLVANRGEIACRIIRTARAMGIRTVAVFSEADAGAMHVGMADAAVPIGPAPARESYLVIDRILEAARETGADAVHPGYGFLSENADFARAVEDAGLCWVGPPPEAIRIMGLKDAAKATMRSAGLPIVPGYQGDDQSLPRLERMAATVGFPLLVKAVAGGGGKGMRPVFSAGEFTEALLAAKREAAAAFGNDSVMLEKLIRRPRHVEVQIFGDRYGNIVHLFERDCSLQRRHQKVIEEAPAPGLSERLRHILGVAAVTAGTAIGYVNAGTVEFLLDMDDRDEAGDPKFYFMEMNTRLQVEHPVTEAITGLDLVEWQLRVARGEMLPLMQEAIEASGWAMEARLCAENPEAGFLPATGTLTRFEVPALARTDTGVRAGDSVTVHYDPLLAKIVVHGPTREAAAAALVAALDRTVVEGITTNRAFLARLAAHPAFVAGDVSTGFIAEHEAALFAPPPDDPAIVAAVALAEAPLQPGATGFAAPFRLNLPMTVHGALFAPDGRAWKTVVEGTGANRRVLVDGVEVAPCPHAVLVAGEEAVEARRGGETWRFLRHHPRRGTEGESAGDGRILAPMPGRVLSLDVAPGDRVEAGDRLLVLEAMKMEHRLTAPFAGTVERVAVSAGQQVSEGATLVTLSASG
ncbi:acetyl/propionyl/methylcrotonyl-CoA carboxylase subunit alpha [Thermaurantiacus tibetensis]|uniref:acetyl/propionyl/methylcrotonyl-CoA carboxylase subunit alpha n=1 Tax=Thermaurantiacus tibetensis TaxID=2759035 RepID=UPI0018906CA7|nr:biotin carboxylase N-terminal domain-containing protein [Thermaurantiacus tibetensis]